MQPSVPAQTSGWSVLIILKLLHNAIKHYNYRKLNIQSTHFMENLWAWRLIQLWGFFFFFRDDGFRGCVERRMISRKMVNHLGKETQGENKARRKCTCQTELQQSASIPASYVTALWSADVQVRRGKKEKVLPR